MVLISKEINEIMNAQIMKELGSAYIYLGISTWAEEKSLHNMAKWFDAQAKEEYTHAERFVNYIIETGGHVEYQTIDGVKTDFEGVEDCIKATIEHEEYITGEIKKILEKAMELKEYEAIEMLQWFIKEQIEEEAQSNELLATYILLRKNDALWDHHLHRDEE
ncbi:MAG: ferritin [Candidatus Lokiarchaeota archaeon]|nr:ferritin [Candidatus Lokiarchaeota archaeon]MCK4281376.1 ferritin [Candidatus Lokiarchaeota archaeon]